MKKSRLLASTAYVFVISLALGFQSNVLAALALLNAGVTVNSYVSSSEYPSDNICSGETGGSGEAPPQQCQGTYNFLGSTLDYNVTSLADYGILRISSETTIISATPSSGGPDSIVAEGSAGFVDTWVINGGIPGTTGTLGLTFDVDGTYSNSSSASVSLFLRMHTSINEFGVDEITNLPPHTGILTAPFTFGEEFYLYVDFFSSASLTDLSTGGFTGQTAFINMLDTAIMSDIVVKDSNDDVTPFTLSTASGAALFDELAPSEVPIPPAFWLFGSGLLGLVGIARRKKA